MPDILLFLGAGLVYEWNRLPRIFAVEMKLYAAMAARIDFKSRGKIRPDQRSDLRNVRVDYEPAIACDDTVRLVFLQPVLKRWICIGVNVLFHLHIEALKRLLPIPDLHKESVSKSFRNDRRVQALWSPDDVCFQSDVQSWGSRGCESSLVRCIVYVDFAERS